MLFNLLAPEWNVWCDVHKTAVQNIKGCIRVAIICQQH